MEAEGAEMKAEPAKAEEGRGDGGGGKGEEGGGGRRVEANSRAELSRGSQTERKKERKKENRFSFYQHRQQRRQQRRSSSCFYITKTKLSNSNSRNPTGEEKSLTYF